MSYRGTPVEKAATAIRDIAGGHLFDNGNKRTAQAVAEGLLGPEANSAQIRSVIDQVATGGLRSVEEIAGALGK
jgi:prophage maintenance system killer protein